MFFISSRLLVRYITKIQKLETNFELIKIMGVVFMAKLSLFFYGKKTQLKTCWGGNYITYDYIES